MRKFLIRWWWTTNYPQELRLRLMEAWRSGDVIRNLENAARNDTAREAMINAVRYACHMDEHEQLMKMGILECMQNIDLRREFIGIARERFLI